MIPQGIPNAAPMGVASMSPEELTALLTDPRTPPGTRAAAMRALQMRQPQGMQPQAPAAAAAPAAGPGAGPVDVMGALQQGAAMADRMRGMAGGGAVKGYDDGGSVGIGGGGDDSDLTGIDDTDLTGADIGGMGAGGLSGMDPRFTRMVKSMLAGAQGAPTKEDKGLALAQMGFGMAASGSPHFGQAVGQGALVGLDALQKLRQQRAVQAMRAAALAEQAGYHGDLLRTRKDIADQQAGIRQQLADAAKERAQAAKEAQERGDWVAGGVDPDTGNVVLYNKRDPRQTKVIASRPKPAGGVGGLAAKISAFEEQYDHPTALKLATGEFKAVQDPFTHQSTYWDVANNKPAVLVPKTAAPAPAPAALPAPDATAPPVPAPGPAVPAPALAPAAVPATPQPPPDVPLLGDATFMGPKAYIQARGQKLTLGLTDPGPELNEARAKLGQLRLQAVDAFGGMAHMSKAKIDMLNDVLPEKGFFSSPKLAYDKLASLATQTQNNVKDDLAIRDDNTASPQARRDAEKRINASNKLLRMIGDPSQFKRPVDTTAAPTSVTLDPATEALMRKYLPAQ